MFIEAIFHLYFLISGVPFTNEESIHVNMEESVSPSIISIEEKKINIEKGPITDLHILAQYCV